MALYVMSVDLEIMFMPRMASLKSRFPVDLGTPVPGVCDAGTGPALGVEGFAREVVY